LVVIRERFLALKSSFLHLWVFWSWHWHKNSALLLLPQALETSFILPCRMADAAFSKAWLGHINKVEFVFNLILLIIFARKILF
jgi:hypothetical protein